MKNDWQIVYCEINRIWVSSHVEEKQVAFSSISRSTLPYRVKRHERTCSGFWRGGRRRRLETKLFSQFLFLDARMRAVDMNIWMPESSSYSRKLVTVMLEFYAQRGSRENTRVARFFFVLLNSRSFCHRPMYGRWSPRLLDVEKYMSKDSIDLVIPLIPNREFSRFGYRHTSSINRWQLTFSKIDELKRKKRKIGRVMGSDWGPQTSKPNK